MVYCKRRKQKGSNASTLWCLLFAAHECFNVQIRLKIQYDMTATCLPAEMCTRLRCQSKALYRAKQLIELRLKCVIRDVTDLNCQMLVHTRLQPKNRIAGINAVTQLKQNVICHSIICRIILVDKTSTVFLFNQETMYSLVCRAYVLWMSGDQRSLLNTLGYIVLLHNTEPVNKLSLESFSSNNSQFVDNVDSTVNVTINF